MVNEDKCTVLVDADFLVSHPNNAARLFKLVNSHRNLEVTVIYECLKRACQSQNIRLDKFLSTFPQQGVKVIDRKDLEEYKREGFLAYVDNAKQYTPDFDSQLEIAYTFTLGI